MLDAKLIRTKIKHAGILRVAWRALQIYAYRLRKKIYHSYSQYGEDLHVHRLLGFPKKGVYVDIGAYDPIVLNNTYYFYKRGWRGINIEPSVINFQRFVQIRSEDINLNIGVGAAADELCFYEMNVATRSTFSETEMKKNIEQGFHVIQKHNVCVQPLSTILQNNLQDDHIDFLSVDTEGMDLVVLESNNWERYRPKIICVEAYENDERTVVGEKKINREIEDFLIEKGYTKVHDNGTNCLYLCSA